MVRLIHQSVVDSALRLPEACAFRCGSKSITYSALDHRSGQLAAMLVREGAKPGDRVGVFMPRCTESIVAVYGILKAGCVFVPVDPGLSAGSVATLLRDCGIRHLLTQPKKKRVLDRLVAETTDLECVIGCVEYEKPPNIRSFHWHDFHEFTPITEIDGIQEDDPAYIMYSSGSTGQPKGITHTHFSGLSYSRLSIQTYGVTSNDVIANHSPISFDMSTFGYFTSMLAGATTVLIPEAHTKFPASLAKLIESERITIWYSVPLALVQLLTRTDLANFDMRSIRWVKYGGEPFAPKHLKSLMRAWPQSRVSNVYGPAEVNQCTYYHVPTGFPDDPSDEPIPIGSVWDQSEGVILDENDQVILGEDAGELVIATPTMMKGYWARPERTARSFWYKSEPDGSQRKYYRTGDKVRRRPDGQLMFLGRMDRQVKIRGYRIELDEIENAINALAEVEEAAVYCVDNEESREIHATVIPKSGITVLSERISSQLVETLSPYSIPSVIQLVSEMPRTSSGKINRKRLAEQAESVGT